MKTVRINGVHYAMLSELAKKYRMKTENLIEKIIQDAFNSKK